MKSKLVLISLISLGTLGYAQSTGDVGINTSIPEATLDVNVKLSNVDGDTNEGIIAPRLTKVRVANIANPVEGTLVYITDAVYTGSNPTVSKVTEKGYYYFDGVEWVNKNYEGGSSVGGGNTYTAGKGMILNGTEFSRTGLEEITEGGRKGWRLIGQNVNNYGDIGSNAIDFSIAGGPSDTRGATGSISFATGYLTTASGSFSTAMGNASTASGSNSIAIGNGTTASQAYSIAMGRNTTAAGNSSVAMGINSTASGSYSVALGSTTTALGSGSFAMGRDTEAKGIYSTVMGNGTKALGNYSTAMGLNVEATGGYSVAIGSNSTATNAYSVAVGNGVKSSANHAVAMGFNTVASGDHSVALGSENTASGDGSFAVGRYNKATGRYSFSTGFNTIVSDDYSVAMGRYNTEGTGRLFTLGNGTTTANRSDAFTVLQDGKTGVGIDNFENTTSNAKLQVNGSIKVSSDSNVTCNANNVGTIRFVNDTFEGCTSTGWKALHQ